MNSSEFQAAKKLDECKFFLDQMINPANVKKWDYYFSAFIVYWRSIIDILLYDFGLYFDQRAQFLEEPY